VTRVYLDTTIYVEVFLGPAAQHFAACQAVLEAGRVGQVEVVISGLVVAEALGSPPIRNPQGQPKAVGDARTAKAFAYFNRCKFLRVEMPFSVGERAASLAAQFEMKGPDASHVALAEYARCTHLLSLDRAHMNLADRIPGLKAGPPSILEIQPALM
jgi:predicted nucleic acid-binding protein